MGGVVRPPALFNAGDGNLGFRLAPHQHAGVENAVLFGSDQFLAVYEEHGCVALVDDKQFGNRSRLGGFRDRESAGGDGLGQGNIGQDAILVRLQGEQNEIVIGLRFAEPHGAEVVLDLIFHSFVFLHFHG